MKAETTSQKLDRAREILLIKTFEENGETLIRIPLFGLHGKGKHMVVTALTWHKGRAAGWPAKWTLQHEQTSGRYYVTTCKKPTAKDGIATPLARLIMDAGPGEAVAFIDGNSLNLRDSNLVKLPAGQQWTFRRWSEDIEEVEALDEASPEKLPWEE